MEKKVRYSHQRERIYEYLLASIEHPSAEMVYEALRPEIRGLSLGTVYRNLKLLEDLGKVRRVTTHQGSERYDAICGDHIHFICHSCGTIRDINGVDTEQRKHTAERRIRSLQAGSRDHRALSPVHPTSFQLKI